MKFKQNQRNKINIQMPFQKSSACNMYCSCIENNWNSVVRNDYPLLLTKTFLHERSSTPCLLANGRDLKQRD